MADVTLPGMAIGVVTRIVRDRDFCFLRDRAGTEYLAHQKVFVGRMFDDLNEGDGLVFKVSETPKGFRAFGVRKPNAGDETVAVEEIREALVDANGNR